MLLIIIRKIDKTIVEELQQDLFDFLPTILEKKDSVINIGKEIPVIADQDEYFASQLIKELCTLILEKIENIDDPSWISNDLGSLYEENKYLTKKLLELLRINIKNLETVDRNVDLIQQFIEIIQEIEEKISSDYLNEIFKHIKIKKQKKS